MLFLAHIHTKHQNGYQYLWTILCMQNKGLKYNCTLDCVSVLLSALWWLCLAITEWVCQFKIDLYASWCKTKPDLLDLFVKCLACWLCCIIHNSYSYS